MLAALWWLVHGRCDPFRLYTEVIRPRVWNVPPDGNRPPGPELTGSARDAALHRGSHVQIIAAAGSGKTEVVSQRVAHLLAGGQPADSIVAFTFTERAADELKNRIAHRVEDKLGTAALDQLAALFVGNWSSAAVQSLSSTRWAIRI